MNKADKLTEIVGRMRVGSLAKEPRVRSTYFDHAGDVETELGGRFGKLVPTTVVGSEPSVKYPKIAEGPWAKDECPDEPSLGYSVDEQEPVGSTPAAPVVGAAAAAPEVVPPVAVAVGSTSRRSKRRI